MQEYNWLERFHFLNFSVIDSTEKECERILSRDINSEYVVLANECNEPNIFYNLGKGPAAISIIVNLHPDTTPIKTLFVFILSIIKALDNTKEDIRYKWPSSIFINNTDSCMACLNVTNSKNKAKRIIVSCMIAKTINKDYIAFTDSIMKNFHKFEVTSKELGFEYITDALSKYAARINETFSIECGKEKIIGLFNNIDHEGNLVMILHDGRKHIVDATEIFHEVRQHWCVR